MPLTEIYEIVLSSKSVENGPTRTQQGRRSCCK